MPYWLHGKTDPPESGSPYQHRSSAHRAMESPKSQTITFVASEEEKRDWRGRETYRFADGTYTKVPWKDEDWYRESAHRLLHFVHLSVSHQGLVAYTPSEEHGVSDRQIRVKTGKYLLEFFPERQQREIDEWVVRVAHAFDPAPSAELHFAVTADEIVAVYRAGCSSCMNNPEEFRQAYRLEPIRAYGESDLQLAYLGDPKLSHGVTARGLVWPARKEMSRLYGDKACELENLLRAAGYNRDPKHVFGKLEGARIRAIKHDGGWLLPYIDACAYAVLSEDRQWFELTNDYARCGYDARITNGGVEFDEDDEDDDDGHDDLPNCEHCGDACDEYGDTWCRDCFDNHYCCARCEGDYFDSQDATYVETVGTVCEDCEGEYETECAREGCHRVWIELNEFTANERDSRIKEHLTHLCPLCAESYRQCPECEAVYPAVQGSCFCMALVVVPVGERGVHVQV